MREAAARDDMLGVWPDHTSQGRGVPRWPPALVALRKQKLHMQFEHLYRSIAPSIDKAWELQKGVR